MADVAVQVPAGDEPPSREKAGDDQAWRTVGEGHGGGGVQVTITFAPVQTQALRVLVTANRAGEDYTIVSEVEAYEK